MAITDTPQGGSDVNKCRVYKERERRARETAAFRNLRHTLELADTQAFWRMEKVDIAEGAVYLIERMAGGSTEQIPEREPIVFDEDKNTNQEEKLNRVEVEKRRRARESKAVKKLKEILIKYSNAAHVKMDKLEVLTAAADFLKALSLANRAKNESSDGSNSPGSNATPVSSTSTSPASDSGNGSEISGLSPEQILLASLMPTLPFFPISNPLLFPTTLALGSSNVLSNIQPIGEKKEEMWRPWE